MCTFSKGEHELIHEALPSLETGEEMTREGIRRTSMCWKLGGGGGKQAEVIRFVMFLIGQWIRHDN